MSTSAARRSHGGGRLQHDHPLATESAGRQVSGSVGGEDLDSLADVQGIRVENRGGTVKVAPATATELDPVTFTSARPGAQDRHSILDLILIH